MSEKQAKKKRQEATEIQYKIEIEVFKNGKVKVRGPIQDYFFFSHLMNCADREVIEYHKRLREELKNKRIIQPGGIITPIH